MAVDFEVGYHGSVTQIIPLTQEAKDWIDENVHTESWQWMGGALGSICFGMFVIFRMIKVDI